MPSSAFASSRPLLLHRRSLHSHSSTCNRRRPTYQAPYLSISTSPPSSSQPSRDNPRNDSSNNPRDSSRDDSRDDSREDSHNQNASNSPISSDSTNASNLDNVPTSQSPRTSPSLAALNRPDITVDPVKSVPAALVDASGSLQIDDGSFGPSPVMPRRLVKRIPRTGRLDLARLREQLKAGFDTGIGAALLLMTLFGAWYWANTVFNVYNKQVLKVFPYPVTCTVVQFVVAGCFMAALWLLRLKRPPRMNRFLLRFAMPLAVLHAAGFLLTNMSLGKVSVAFTHTVKSTEPFFSVALTPSILGDVPTWGILGSLVPIVAGVALASANEATFNWIGLFSALGSNLALQSRNVLSKRLMDGGGRKRKTLSVSLEEDRTLESLDNVNLFSTISILAFFVLLPVCFLWEGMPLLGAAASTATTGMSTAKLYTMLAIAGACRCLDVLSSYMILKRVSPVTHSVGNCVKRAVVIFVSILFFKSKMNGLNIAGTVLALLGVLMYSLIVSACKQNSLGPDSPFCKPIYEPELELTEGGGI